MEGSFRLYPTATCRESRRPRRLNARLFPAFEPALGKLAWRWKLNDLDLSDKMAELDYGIKAVERAILTPNQARGRLGLEPYDGGDTFCLAQALVPVGQDRVTKARGDDASADWARLHRHHEQVLGEKVRDFSAARRSARSPTVDELERRPNELRAAIGYYRERTVDWDPEWSATEEAGSRAV